MAEVEAARVLVIDDQAELRGLLSQLLTDLGYAVESVGDGTAALERLKEGAPPRVIVLDIVMKPMDGLRFLRELSVIPWLTGIPIIIWTAHRGVQAHPPAAAAKVFGKPVDIVALVAAVSELAQRVRSGACLAHHAPGCYARR
jgi:two-component system, NtrC family, nitrogen regulation response regulator NtrX